MAIITLISAGIAFSVAWIAFRRGPFAGRRKIVLLLIALGLWSLLSSIHTLVTDTATRILIAQIQHVVIHSIPILWLLVTLQVVGQRLPSRRSLGLLMILPIISVGMAWTNGWHNLFWATIEPFDERLVYTPALWFWVIVTYDYLLLLYALFTLVRAIPRTPPSFRPQIYSLLLASSLPWIGNLLYIAQLIPIPGIDPTPIAFTISGIIVAWALMNQRLFDLVPIARSILIEQMQDGVLVLDLQQRIIDQNPAARQISGLRTATIGQALADVLPELVEPVRQSIATAAPILIERFGPHSESIEVQATVLLGRGRQWSGWLIVLRNISLQQQLVRELRAEHDFVLQVMQTMGEGLYVTDATGRFTFVNTAYARMFGYKPEELIGKSPMDVTVAGDQTLLQQMWHERQAGQSSSYVSHLHRADGKVAAVQISGAPRYVNGAFAGSVAVITDLSERLAMEAELRSIQQQLEERNAQLRELAQTDGLTGLHNRATFDERLREEIWRANHAATPLALLLIDVDHFKPYNDTFGHQAGDEVLRAVAELFRSQSRQYDLIARYGGEEFALILPNTDALAALGVAERIRTSIAHAPWPKRTITVSIGTTTLAPGQTPEQMIAQADAALYHAKATGRNNVVSSHSLNRHGNPQPTP